MTYSKDLIEHLISSLKKYKFKSRINNNIIYLEIEKNNLIKIIKFLKDDSKCLFSILVDITFVDHINHHKRFEAIYVLLSIKYNKRIVIKTSLEEKESIDSICNIYESANWYERECYDLFGITFNNHPDLRRIMTDYNFVGHPLRKDFPLTGHTEVRYDELQKKVVYETVKLSQEYRNYDYSSPWEGSKEISKIRENIIKTNETNKK